jgi:hypothetical protein
VTDYTNLIYVFLAGVAIYGALHWSGFFEGRSDSSDRNAWADKKLNIKNGVVSRGASYDDDAENFNLSKDDDVVLGSLIKYPSKLKEPWTSEKNK